VAVVKSKMNEHQEAEEEKYDHILHPASQIWQGCQEV
jgi:hypothetical protein